MAIPALTVGKTNLAVAYLCSITGKELKQTGTNGVEVPLTTPTVECYRLKSRLTR
jgi:hypothetical protein